MKLRNIFKEKRLRTRRAAIRRQLGVECLEDRKLCSAGSLDTSFLFSGKVNTDFTQFARTSDETATAVAVQPDGKIVVVGNSVTTSGQGAYLARYNRDGTLDRLGRVDFNCECSVQVLGVAIHPDGSILVAGSQGYG